MNRTLSIASVLIFAGVFAVAVAANAAAVDYFITRINADGNVSARDVGGRTLSFRVPDARAFGMLKVGQKLSIDLASGKASAQGFNFIILQNVATPSLKTAAALPVDAPRQVMINGKPFSMNAKVVNGKLLVPLEDVSSALGGGITLNSSLKLDFPRLSSVGGAQPSAIFPKVESANKAMPPAAAGSPANVAGYKVSQQLKGSTAQKGSPAQKVSPASKVEGQIKLGGMKLLSANRAGMISSQLQNINGKVYVPLSDILIALGQTPGRANPNAMSLNFTVPQGQGAILGLAQ